jgi:hypothetical protein
MSKEVICEKFVDQCNKMHNSGVKKEGNKYVYYDLPKNERRPPLEKPKKVTRFGKSMMKIYRKEFGKEYPFAYIDMESGDIYSANGKTPKGSVFSEYNGFDAIGPHGVYVNDHKRKVGLELLLKGCVEEL